MIETIDLLPVTSSGLRAVDRELLAPPVCSVLPQGAAILSCELLLTADGTDRLEVSFGAEDVPGGPPAALEACCPGAGVTLRHPLGQLFRGSLHTRGLRRERGGTVLSITALADHRQVARSLGPRAYYQQSDSELASAIAAELGLRAVSECTGEIFERIVCDGDRLEFLRGRARRIGFEVAILPGELFFSSTLPPCAEVSGLPSAPGSLGRDERLLEFSFREHPGLGRGGEFEARGDPGWRPLQEFEISGMGGILDGSYRVARARHRWDQLGYRTRVDYLERSVDLESWGGEQ